MQPGDFWNLVGRAGRMSKEFTGNVYCIHGVEWESEPLKSGRLNAIKSAFRVALTDQVVELAEVAAKPPNSTESELGWAELAVARVYSEFTTKQKRISDSEFANDANRSALVSVDSAMFSLQERQTLQCS